MAQAIVPPTEIVSNPDRLQISLHLISASGSVQTMSWTNDTDYPVLIRGYRIKQGNKGWVKFELYSVPNGRNVVISAPVVENVRRASDSTQLTSTLPAGQRKRIEYPVDGKQVWRTVTVYNADGSILRQKTYYSNYARITGIVLVGQGSTASSDPAPATQNAPPESPASLSYTVAVTDGAAVTTRLAPFVTLHAPPLSARLLRTISEDARAAISYACCGVSQSMIQ